MQNLKLLSLGLLLALMAVGCGGDDEPADTTADPVTVSVAADEGGTVESDDVKLEIPAGALGEDTDVTVTEVKKSSLPDTNDVLSKAYDFGPDGLTFSDPVTLTFENVTVPSGKEVAVAFLENGATTWEVLEGTTVSGKTVTAETTHFTTFAVIVIDGVQTGGSCEAAFDDCGGNPVGTWTIGDGACANLPDGFIPGVDDGEESPLADCEGLDISAAVELTGTLSLEEGLDYTFTKDLVAEIGLSAPKSCFPEETCPEDFTASGTECTQSNTEGDGESTDEGTYTVDGSSITLVKVDGQETDETTLKFCVDGNTLHVQVFTGDGPEIRFNATRGN